MIGKCSFGDLITSVDAPSSMEYKGPFLNTKFLQANFYLRYLSFEHSLDFNSSFNSELSFFVLY